jgi:5-methylcytosine-specific restriction endonuclease McrA
MAKKTEKAGEWITIEKDPEHIAREKRKARDLRRTQWWKNNLAGGICYYCGQKFEPGELTMDHIVPLARGGRSTRNNVVVCCKECNNKKKYMTPAEIALQKINRGKKS